MLLLLINILMKFKSKSIKKFNYREGVRSVPLPPIFYLRCNPIGILPKKQGGWCMITNYPILQGKVLTII